MSFNKNENHSFKYLLQTFRHLTITLYDKSNFLSHQVAIEIYSPQIYFVETKYAVNMFVRKYIFNNKRSTNKNLFHEYFSHLTDILIEGDFKADLIFECVFGSACVLTAFDVTLQ